MNIVVSIQEGIDWLREQQFALEPATHEVLLSKYIKSRLVTMQGLSDRGYLSISLTDSSPQLMEFFDMFDSHIFQQREQVVKHDNIRDKKYVDIYAGGTGTTFFDGVTKKPIPKNSPRLKTTFTGRMLFAIVNTPYGINIKVAQILVESSEELPEGCYLIDDLTTLRQIIDERCKGIEMIGSCGYGQDLGVAEFQEINELL
jgi:hypothetical protein